MCISVGTFGLRRCRCGHCIITQSVHDDRHGWLHHSTDRVPEDLKVVRLCLCFVRVVHAQRDGDFSIQRAFMRK